MHQHLLVCLHGWGGSKESFTELREALRGSPIELLTPDLPGFGAEPEPAKPWNVDDYADWVSEWLERKVPARAGSDGKSEKCKVYLLGHSHGGRIALKLAHRQSTHYSLLTTHYSLAHLFLCAPAGIRHARHIKRIIGLLLAKCGKALLSIPGLKLLQAPAQKILYKLVRVHDYERASAVMRETLIKVSAEDLRPILKTIAVPTDLFWGTDDGMTPYSDALIMKREIPKAILHTYPGIRHGVHRERAKEIAAIIRARLGL